MKKYTHQEIHDYVIGFTTATSDNLTDLDGITSALSNALIMIEDGQDGIKAVTASEKNKKLLPCPFCGREAKLIKDVGAYPFKVKCRICFSTAGGSAFENDEWNIEQWNKRVR